MRYDLECLSRVISGDQIHPNKFILIRSSTCPFSKQSSSYLLTSTMTVSNPPFVFPHTFNSSMIGDHNFPHCNSSDQRHHTERPHLDTGFSAYGNFVSSLLIALTSLLTAYSHMIHLMPSPMHQKGCWRVMAISCEPEWSPSRGHLTLQDYKRS